jgi:hypothetical protein
VIILSGETPYINKGGDAIKRAAVLFALACLALGPVFLMSSPRRQEKRIPPQASAFASILPQEVLGWTKSREDEVFTRDNIFDYMDGAGEIYLAYDFKFVFVREYAREDARSMVVEIYQMSSPRDAFGVFTQDTDGDEVSVGQGAIYAAGLLRFWKNKIFVRILADRETPEVKSVIMDLGAVIVQAEKGEGEKPDILNLLPHEGLDVKTLRYFHTLISLNSHYYLASANILGLSTETNAVLARYAIAGEKLRLLLVTYPSAAAAEAAYTQFASVYLKEKPLPEGKIVAARLENEKYASAFRQGRFLILVLEAAAPSLCEGLSKEISSRLEGKNT